MLACRFARVLVDLLACPLACATMRREKTGENIQRNAKLGVGQIRRDQAGVYQDLRGVVQQVSGFYCRC